MNKDKDDFEEISVPMEKLLENMSPSERASAEFNARHQEYMRQKAEEEGKIPDEEWMKKL